MNDITGARVTVELELDIEPRRMWELITDVSRMGEWSPECLGGAWIGEPGEGARFSAGNQFPSGIGATLSQVTEFSAPERFSWVVLDDTENPARPGSYWSYRLSAGSQPGAVRVWHRFEHGAGNSGLRVGMEQDPNRAEAIREERLERLRANMTSTLRAMAAAKG